MNLTREYFDNPENKVSDKESQEIGFRFMLDFIPVYENGENRDSTDVEIWEVERTKKKIYCKERGQCFTLKKIRLITTGKQFRYPNGYWKVPTDGVQR